MRKAHLFPTCWWSKAPEAWSGSNGPLLSHSASHCLRWAKPPRETGLDDTTAARRLALQVALASSPMKSPRHS